MRNVCGSKDVSITDTLTDSMNLFFCFSLVAFTLKKVDSTFRESYSVTSLEQMPERGQ